MGMYFRPNMTTPWGKIQWHHKINDGVVMIATASHGGIWLSEERTKELPDHYEPYTKSKQWAEEDEDGALVLQYLGLLSLITEPILLDITKTDIQIGMLTRKDYCRKPFYGGPIVEAYKRQYNEDYDKMICTNQMLSPEPGAFKVAILSEEAQVFLTNFDNNKNVNPTTVRLDPYIVHEPKKFIHHFENKTTQTEKAPGSQAHKMLNGDRKAIDNYLQFKKHCGLNLEKTTKVTHGNTVIYQKE